MNYLRALMVLVGLFLLGALLVVLAPFLLVIGIGLLGMLVMWIIAALAKYDPNTDNPFK